MALGDQDGAIFFADGDCAVLADGDVELRGHFRFVEAVENFGSLASVPGAIKGTPTFEFWTANAPDSFKRGAKLTINVTLYELRTDPIAKGDGKISSVALKLPKETTNAD